MSVLLRLGDGRRVLLAGDAAYALRNIHDRVLPMLTFDDRASRQSLDRLASFMADDPEAIVAPSHDPDTWRTLADTVAVASV